MSHDQLRQNEDGLRQHLSVVETIALPVWVFDVDQCRVLWANAAGLELWEADSLDELRRRDMSGDISPTVKSRLEQYREGFEQGQAFTEIWTLYPKGKPKTIRCIFSGIRFDDGRMGMFNQSLEVLDQKESAESLRSIQALLHTSVMISLYDRDDRLLYSNPAARQAYEDADETFRERLVDPDLHASMIASVTTEGEAKRVAMVRTHRGIRWHEVVARSGWDPVTGVPAILVSEVDVTAREEATQQISFLADHDMLTKLPNRRHLEREIVPMLASAQAEAQQLGLLFIDIDRFKTINDTLGHAIGDQLLIDVADHLKDGVQPGDFVARMGGDEFIVVLNGLSGHADAVRFADQLSKKLNRSITIDHHDISVTVSIGVSMFPRDGDSFEALLRYADMAMYSAKEDGRNTTRIFTSALESRLRLKVDLEASIRRGLLDDEFFLLYQPRPRVADNQVESAEALLRWNHPTEGVLGAETFIPLAEESGAIEALDAWVLLSARPSSRRPGIETASISASPSTSRPASFEASAFHQPSESSPGPIAIGRDRSSWSSPSRC